MDRPWLLLSLALVGALGGCDLPLESDGESEGLEALRAARAEADAARYLVAVDRLGFDSEGNRLSQRLEFAPRLTRISQNGRVVLWQRLAPGGARRERDVSYSLRHGQGCYDRHSGEEFERVGVIEMRRGVVVPRELMHEAELDEVGGRTVIRWRGPPSERGTRVEGRLYLDSAGRPVLNRERISWLSRRPPRARYERRYRYPATLTSVRHRGRGARRRRPQPPVTAAAGGASRLMVTPGSAGAWKRPDSAHHPARVLADD